MTPSMASSSPVTMEFSGAFDMDFGMQGYYYASLAEGLLLDPPPLADAGACSWDDGEDCADMALWSHSI